MRRHIIGKQEDPYLHCTICGSEVLLREPDVIKERADWVALCKKRGKAKSRSTIVPSTEVEATDFKKHVFGWMHLYRASRFHPATNCTRAF
jgi:DNA-directed RNA polymerase subunit RPC12/RpoP